MIPLIVNKTCKKCGLPKPTDEFQKLSQSKDGFSYLCKLCKRTRDKSYLLIYRDKYPERIEAYKKSCAKWGKENPEKLKLHGHNSWLRLRNEMLDAYGRRCACCGIDYVEFLTLEHINRDGSAHRLRVGGGANTYRDLKKQGWPKSGYKVLCMNCNWGIRRGGICPHQREHTVN